MTLIFDDVHVFASVPNENRRLSTCMLQDILDEVTAIRIDLLKGVRESMLSCGNLHNAVFPYHIICLFKINKYGQYLLIKE